MSDELGLGEAVSMALGGMIGGGIYAVLGVVAQAAGRGAWLAFLPLLFYRLAARQPRVFESVVAIGATVLLLEVLYFKRESILEGLSLERLRT